MKKQIVKITETQLNKIIKESVKQIQEAYTTTQWQHFDNNPKRYDSYVLVADGDGAILANYQVYPGDFWKNVLEDAINDANEEANNNHYGSYSVYGCENNEYDEDTLVYSTVDNTAMNESKNRNPYDDAKINNGTTQPLKDNVSLYDVRSRLNNLMQSLQSNNIEDAKKQTKRLYKLVDAMINQGY